MLDRLYLGFSLSVIDGIHKPVMIHDGNIDGVSAQVYVDVFGCYGVDEYIYFSRCSCLC